MPFGQDAPIVLPKQLKRYYEGTLWSTWRYADTTAVANTVNRLFSVAIGATGQGFGAALSLAETNLLEQSRIPTGQAYTVYAVAAEPRYDDNANPSRMDIANLQLNSLFRWFLLNTTIEMAPLNLIGQGGGISGGTADTGAVEGGAGGARVFLNSGFGQVWTYDTLAVLLPASTTFNVEHVWGANATAVDGGLTAADLLVRCSLLGSTMTAVPVG